MSGSQPLVVQEPVAKDSRLAPDHAPTHHPTMEDETAARKDLRGKRYIVWIGNVLFMEAFRSGVNLAPAADYVWEDSRSESGIVPNLGPDMEVVIVPDSDPKEKFEFVISNLVRSMATTRNGLVSRLVRRAVKTVRCREIDHVIIQLLNTTDGTAPRLDLLSR